jgi:hypothetical protein
MRRALVAALAVLAAGGSEPSAFESIRLDPAGIAIDRPFRMLVSGLRKDGLWEDLSERADLESLDTAVVRIEEGRAVPVRDGAARIRATMGSLRVETRVEARVADRGRPPDFQLDVLPVLTRFGCNGGACHGSAKGQGEFKLSLLGYDADADFDSVALEMRSRRIHRGRPEESLLIQKPLGQVKHGGGRRFKADSEPHRRLVDWIRAGAPRRTREAALRSIRVHPPARILPADATQRIVVEAVYSDGMSRDVTDEALFAANDDSIVSVTPGGLARAKRGGETAVVVRYGGHVAPVAIASPVGDSPPPEFQAANLVDEILGRKWAELRLRPAPPAPDAVFLRRAFLDAIGTLPTPDEARGFLADRAPDKRARLVDALLARPEFVSFWTLKVSEMLLVGAGVFPAAYVDWIRGRIAADDSLADMARSLVAATGREAPAWYFRISSDPRLLMETTIQNFHGFRMQCANCHNHPLERFGQDEYHGLAAFFAKARFEGDRLVDSGATELTHPKTGRPVPPSLPGGSRGPFDDRRRAFAKWLVEDPRFARAMANRVWAEAFGRGIVEPVDDLRASNPPSVPELLEALAAEFSRNPRLRPFLRLIMNSNAYGLDSKGGGDERWFARAVVKPLGPEVLLDAIAQATGIPNDFGRAIEQFQPGASKEYSLEAFGRCGRDTLCTLKAEFAGSLKQALHLVSDDVVNGRVERARLPAEPREVVEELYLRALSRPPTAKERSHWAARLGAREAAEDLFWALLVSREFQFRH